MVLRVNLFVFEYRTVTDDGRLLTGGRNSDGQLGHADRLARANSYI